jgi:hypothetical protein
VQKSDDVERFVVVRKPAAFLILKFSLLKSRTWVSRGALNTSLSTEIVGNYSMSGVRNFAVGKRSLVLPSFWAREKLP